MLACSLLPHLDGPHCSRLVTLSPPGAPPRSWSETRAVTAPIAMPIIRVARTFIIPSELQFCPSIVTILHYAATFVAQAINASQPSADTGTVERGEKPGSGDDPTFAQNSTEQHEGGDADGPQEQTSMPTKQCPTCSKELAADHECWWRYHAYGRLLMRSQQPEDVGRGIRAKSPADISHNIAA